MRSRILPVAGVTAAALACAMAFAPIAGASGHSVGVATKGHASTIHYATIAKTCYSQGTTLDGYGVSSQNFEATFDAYDDYAGNGFSVKKKCKIKHFAVAGQYNGAGGVQTVNVLFFHLGSDGLPSGDPFIEQDNVKVTDDGTGNFTGKIKTVKLKKGNYAFGVQANLDFSTGGQWYWNVATDGNGEGVWENEGGGFGVCQTWGTIETCNGAPDGSLSFSLS